MLSTHLLKGNGKQRDAKKLVDVSQYIVHTNFSGCSSSKKRLMYLFYCEFLKDFLSCCWLLEKRGVL